MATLIPMFSGSNNTDSDITVRRQGAVNISALVVAILDSRLPVRRAVLAKVPMSCWVAVEISHTSRDKRYFKPISG